MWDTRISEPAPGVRRHQPNHDGKPVSWKQALHLWTCDTEFQDFFGRLLEDSPFDACFWETPPVTLPRLGEAFEFVLVDAPRLAAVRADPRSFREHFRRNGPVVAFDNLGGDARLIVPCPSADDTDYAHLAAFARTAPDSQQRALWSRTGSEARARLGSAPLWISTSGLGVDWLHVRLDTVPKYYTWAPYRRFAGD